jgi:hypothetical protein
MLRGRRDHTTLAVLLRGKRGEEVRAQVKRVLSEVLEKHQKLGDDGWSVSLCALIKSRF